MGGTLGVYLSESFGARNSSGAQASGPYRERWVASKHRPGSDFGLFPACHGSRGPSGAPWIVSDAASRRDAPCAPLVNEADAPYLPRKESPCSAGLAGEDER